jgi:exosortase
MLPRLRLSVSAGLREPFFSSPREALAVGGLAVALLWVFWPSLADMAGAWLGSSQYSHGFVVPLFAGYLLWARREKLAGAGLRPSLWGLPVLAAGLGLRFAGTYIFFDWFSAAALIPCLMGVVLLWGGWRGLGWAWPAIAFLVFMIPLPYRLEVALAHPLQRLATVVSTYSLQTLGFVAFSDGNIIRLGTVPLNVAEACSGLKMLMVFFALSTGVVLIVPQAWWKRAVILLSAIPIAILANLIRIIVTAILYKTVDSEIAEVVFHDVFGYLMPFIALALLWAELGLLSWMVISSPVEEMPLFPFGGFGPQPVKANGQKVEHKPKVRPGTPAVARPKVQAAKP